MRRSLRAGDIVHDEFGNPLELVEKLGRGGQGEVWSVPGGRAAVKVLTTTKSKDAERLRMRLALVRRFDLSGVPIARPLAMLSAERVGYVMELLADMTGIGALAVVPSQHTASAVDWYRRTGGLRHRLRLLTLAAEALGALHGRAIVYGDVSPSNLLVSRGTGHEQVWLIDPDNLIVESSPVDQSCHSPGYGAPELVAQQTGCNTSTDVFSFAALAFQVLTLIHPFRGDQVYADPALEEVAFSGRLPWVDHQTDDRNRTRLGLARDSVLTKGLSTLFRKTFETGLHTPDNRPLMSEWRTKLDQAALSTIGCPRCRGTYYAHAASCPWCGTIRPHIARCDLHAHVPLQPDLPELNSAVESTRLESVMVTAGEPVLIRARNALICLDRGPSALAVDPDEPAVEIRWNGRSSVLVERLGRHEIWMLDALGHNALPLRAGEPRELPTSELGPWTLRFGPAEQVHRLLRFKWTQGAGR